MDDDLPPELDDFEESLKLNREKDSQQNTEFIGDYTVTRDQQFKTTINAQSSTVTQKETENLKQKSTSGNDDEFLKGFQKGFLLSDDDGQKGTVSTQNGDTKGDIIEVQSNPNDPQKNNDKLIPQVQEAMQMQSYLKENQKEWVNDDLLDEVTKNEKLQKLFNNQQYLNAFMMMEKQPKKVMETYGQNPQFLMLYQQFCKLMGNHFQKLEEKTGKTSPQQTSVQTNTSSPAVQAPKIQEISSTTNTKQTNPVPSETPDQQALREQIESDQEVQAILSDPQMISFIQYLQSGKPVDLHQVIRSDEVLGQKIMVLVQKGVLNMSAAPGQ